MVLRFGCVVEGHGETESVPILLRRIGGTIAPDLTLEIPPPIRVMKSKLCKPGELERAVEMAARKIGGHGSIVVFVDSDEDCPAELGPALLVRATAARSLPTAVVVATMEFETWFLASAESLRGVHGLAPDLTGPDDPETIRGAKEWLGKRMADPGSYAATLLQPALTAVFDLGAARRADSFDKCYREMVRLIGGAVAEPSSLSGE